MKKRNKKYIPSGKFNPATQSIRIDRLAKDVENHGKAIQALSKSHDNHISYLGNFARHDIKNAILSMDSILTTTSPSEFTEEKIDSMTIFLEVIRNTIENFSKLIPYSRNGKFKLETLFIAVELLSRADMQNNNIELNLNFKRESEIELDFPFQSILQMVNNMIINSIKSLESGLEKKILLEGEVVNNCLIIRISDNGVVVPQENIEKIFEYGFSTTGGSGIGLYHAKYLCEQFSGNISLHCHNEDGFTKTFTLNLPTEKNGKNDSNN